MKTYILPFSDVTNLLFAHVALQKLVQKSSVHKEVTGPQPSEGKRQNRSQEKFLLIILTCMYWIIALTICWFSFNSVMQFLTKTLFQIDMLTFQNP